MVKASIRTPRAATGQTIEHEAAPAGDKPFRSGATITRTDARGRVITFKQLSLLEEMDLLAVAGADNARNGRWMMYATMGCCIRSIDGEPIAPSGTLNTRLLRARMQQVGAEGVAVVAEQIAQETPQNDDEDEPDDTEAVAKN